MSPKYSVDDSDATMHYDDWQHVLHQWSTNPFLDVRHRHETVQQRLVVEYTHGIGVDIVWEARSQDTEKFADDWEAVERIEVREYGLRHDRRPEARWLQ